MECEKCGAELPAGSESCPKCDATAAGSPESAATVPSREISLERLAPVAEPDKPPVPMAVVAVIAVVALAIVGFGLFYLWQTFAPANTPESAVLRTMSALAAYDGKAVLDNSTHSSMTASDVVQFEQQLSVQKASAKGLPALKNVKITKTTLSSDGNSAKVEFTAQWLDATKGTFTQRNDQLTAVKINGRWLARLFQ